MSELQAYVNEKVAILTNDGRIIIGTLKGFDQTTNVILAASVERVFADDGVQELPLGLYIVRGDNIAAIGQLDVETDETIDWPRVKAQPLAPMRGGL